MNIKSLLIGSAAALVAVSGARAADAIVAAEPEPVEYVRVCDAFGTGYFYIPGTETCLKIGGYVRVQNNFANVNITNGAAFTAATGFAALIDREELSQTTRANFSFSAKSDTEYGTLSGVMVIQANDGAAFTTDEAYIELGGFKTGRFYHWNDRGLKGDTDGVAGAVTRFNSIMYTMNADSYYVGLSLDQQTAAWAGNSAVFGNTDGVGVSGIVGFTMGAVTADVVGYYDTNADEGGVRLLASAEVGPGTLGFSALYNSGANAYYTANGYGVTAVAAAYTEWYIGADYTFAVSDKMKLGVAGQYESIKTAVANPVSFGDMWTVGTTLDYAITDGLAFKANVNYQKLDGKANVGNIEREAVYGYVRLQRSF
jgi:hypothetical protein